MAAPRIYDVFISYSRQDAEFVHTLHSALEQSDKQTWVDWDDIQVSDDWWQRIQEAIEGADTFLFVVTPNSVTSEYCQKEVACASDAHKRILPVLRQEVVLQQLPEAVSSHQWLLFRESDPFDQALGHLVDALDLDLDYRHAHTRLLVRAREWDQNNRKNDFLLRGTDLKAAEEWLSQSTREEPKSTYLQRIYIEKSRKTEDAIAIRNRTALSLVLLLSTGLVGGGAIAHSLIQAISNGAVASSASSQSLIKSFREQPFEALLSGLQAGQRLRNIPSLYGSIAEDHQMHVSAALQQALARLREHNQLSGHRDEITDISFR